MVRRSSSFAAAMAAAVLAVACSQEPQSPISPSATTGDTAASADGSTLKVSAPNLVSPVGGGQLDTVRPTFTFSNSIGRFTAVPVVYRLELLDAADQFVGARSVARGEGATTTYVSDVDLSADTEYHWRVRAEYEGQAGPWSAVGSFKTKVLPVAGGPVTGNVGPPRNISFDEAFGIIVNIHDTLRVNLGSSSTREYRIAFLNAAVAAIHYGHPRFNAAGPDSNWCVKDAGGGRPQSDDVIVVCSTRDAWDLIGGAGANGYRFHEDYLGKLPSGQNVYPPPRSALGFLGS